MLLIKKFFLIIKNLVRWIGKGREKGKEARKGGEGKGRKRKGERKRGEE